MTYRWQKTKAEVNHADDWLMTYVDVITLLLCFFAIIMITTTLKKNAQPKTPTPPIAEQAQQIPPSPPVIQSTQQKIFDVFPGNLPFHPIEEADSQEENIPEPLPIKAEQAVAAVEPTPMSLPEEVSATAPAVIPTPELSLPVPVADAKPQVPNNIEKKGDRITILELNSAAFFDSGSAVLSNAGMSILRDVAIKLKSDQFKDYQITVEGHTDDTPIHTTQFPSNWELSTARASAVVHYFLEQGVPAIKLRAAGYADTFPKVPNRDSNGNPIAENRAENRRVVIKLEKIENN